MLKNPNHNALNMKILVNVEGLILDLFHGT